jgi:hypothetical protein
VIAGDRLGHLDQVALATERPAIDARVLEPANCSVLGRAHDRAEGRLRLPLLQPGEERGTRIPISVEEVE